MQENGKLFSFLVIFLVLSTFAPKFDRTVKNTESEKHYAAIGSALNGKSANTLAFDVKTITEGTLLGFHSVVS
jgi:hypothetical protein